MRSLNYYFNAKKGFTLLLLIGFSLNFYGQEANYPQVDSATYYHFENKEWKELIEVGAKQDFDYYYFNVRMGIAHYSVNQFYFAEHYLKRALENNNTDYARKFLFWTYLKLGELDLAGQTYDLISKEERNVMHYEPGFMESFYIEGGIKVPNSNLVGNMNYGTLAVKHRLGKKFRFNYSLMPFSQKITERKLTNMQFNAFLGYRVKQAYFSAGVMLANAKVKDNYLIEDFNFDDSDVKGHLKIDGNINSNTVSYLFNYNQRLGRFDFNINLNYTSQSSSFDYTNRAILWDNNDQPLPDSTSKYVSSGGRYAFIPSVGASYFPKIFKDKVGFGADVFFAFYENSTEVVFKPNISILFSDKLWLNASYFEIKNKLFSDYTTAIFYNANQETNRFKGTLSYLINPLVIIKATYLYEGITDRDPFFGISYGMHSGFLGVQFLF